MTGCTVTGGTRRSAPGGPHSRRETVSLDIDGEPTLIWSGPAVAPMAVAAVFCFYGRLAMIEHPGLASLRVSPNLSEEARMAR